MSNVPTLPEHGPLKTNVEDLLALLGRPHMLGIIYIVGQVLEAPVRFGDILKLAQTSPTTVSKRLKEAVAAGLLTRHIHDENPPRVEYAPTPRLRELEPVFYRLNRWCRKHELGTPGESIDATAQET